MSKKVICVIAITVLIVCVFLLYSCNVQSDFNGFALGTAYSIRLNKSIKQERVQALLDSIEQKLSVNIAQSDIYRINHSQKDEWIEVSEDTMMLINESFEYAKVTDNAFNVAVFPLVELWGFAPPFVSNVHNSLPKPSEVTKQLQVASYNFFEINGKRIKRTDTSAALDLGGIAKGYAADILANYLKEQNCKGLINIGGTIVSLGKNSKIGIEPPRDSEFYYIVSFELQEGEACATSGDYERYYIVDGKRYHHIIGRNGYPVDNEIMSVTIICDSAQKADILSTVAFVDGESAIGIIKDNKAKAIMVQKDRSIITVGVDIIIKDNNYTIQKRL